MTGIWNWDAIYLTCFGVGFALCVISFVMGAGHFHLGHLHFGGHGHIGGHGHAGGHAGGAGTRAVSSISAINGFTVTAFLCWFGGIGYILRHSGIFGGLLVLLLSTLGGMAGASLLMLFLTKVLMPHERTLEPEDTEMTGVVGRISSTVPASGFGEILFSQNGARRSMAVKSDNGTVIERDVEVIVMRYARGVAYVRRWDEFEGGLLRDDHRPEEQETPMREP